MKRPLAVFREPRTFTYKRMVGNHLKVAKVQGEIEMVVDVEGLFRYLSEKVTFNATRRSRLLSGLISACAVGVNGVEVGR